MFWWTFHCWVVSQHSLCRSSLPCLDALQKRSAPSCPYTRNTGIHRLRRYSLTSSISDRKTISVVQNQTVSESPKCFHFAKNPPLWQISPFSSFWPVLSWMLQLSSLKSERAWFALYRNEVHRALVWTSQVLPVTWTTEVKIISSGAVIARTHN